jgi:aryl-alcohol dehydrogenase-like predicted oxidoreductase
VRHIGLSNETPYGVHEFVRWPSSTACRAWPRVQNVYCLINRTVDNALDETLHRLGVSLLAYSPLGFGLLTGKYDQSGTDWPRRAAEARIARLSRCASSAGAGPRRWPAARRYNAAGARQRHHAHADGAGLLLHQAGAWPAPSSA